MKIIASLLALWLLPAALSVNKRVAGSSPAGGAYTEGQAFTKVANSGFLFFASNLQTVLMGHPGRPFYWVGQHLSLYLSKLMN